MTRVVTLGLLSGLLTLSFALPATAQVQIAPDNKDYSSPSNGGGTCPPNDLCCICKKACDQSRTTAGNTCNVLYVFSAIGRRTCLLEADRQKRTCYTQCNADGVCNDSSMP